MHKWSGQGDQDGSWSRLALLLPCVGPWTPNETDLMGWKYNLLLTPSTVLIVKIFKTRTRPPSDREAIRQWKNCQMYLISEAYETTVCLPLHRRCWLITFFSDFGQIRNNICRSWWFNKSTLQNGIRFCLISRLEIFVVYVMREKQFNLSVGIFLWKSEIKYRCIKKNVPIGGPNPSMFCIQRCTHQTSEPNKILYLDFVLFNIIGRVCTVKRWRFICVSGKLHKKQQVLLKRNSKH